ncbi:MAG: CHAT domain-containing tetratricopeptide repeat protein [Blastocatellia bacterium]
MIQQALQRTLSRVLFAALLLACYPSHAARAQQAVRQLEPGKPIERELPAGEVHSYQVILATDQFFRVIVDQRGIDVVVAVFGPDGTLIKEVDNPNGEHGPESVWLVAESSGSYRVEVRPLEIDAKAGRYEVRIGELRAATLKDRTSVIAEKAEWEAGQLQGEQTAEAIRKAIEKVQQALLLWQSVGDREREAGALTFIGNLHQELIEYRKANEFYIRSLAIYRLLGDRAREATALATIGALSDIFGDNQKMFEYLHQALPLLRDIGDWDNEGTVLNNLGYFYGQFGDRQKHLDYLNRALAVYRAVRSYSGEAQLLHNIGRAYYKWGENQKALDSLNESLTLWQQQTNTGPGQARTLFAIASVYRDSGENQKAIELLNQALTIWRREIDRYEEALTIGGIAKVYSSSGEQSEALDLYGQSLVLLRAVGHRQGEADTLNSIGSLYSWSGQRQKAIEHHRLALSINRAVADRRAEAGTIYEIARVERDQGNPAEARRQIEAALDIVESLRTNLTSLELRASYFATVQKYYEFYTDLLMQMYKQNNDKAYVADALSASERGRARSLLETLREARANIRQGVSPELLERERVLQQKLNGRAEAHTKLLNGRHTDAQASEAAKELAALTTEYQQVQARIRQSSPRYAALTQPEPLSLKEIQSQVLDSDTLLLEYALGDEQSYLWAVTPTSVTAYELPKRAEIETAARRVYDLLTARNQRKAGEVSEERRARVAQAEKELPEASARLSKILLDPVAAQLGAKRLLIVADGALQYIPFAALPILVLSGQPAAVSNERSNATAPMAKSNGQKPENKNWPLTTDHRPLIADHEIVLLPSASALAVLRRETANRRPAERAVAVLADPVFGKDDERLGRLPKDKGTIADGDRQTPTTASESPSVPNGLERAVKEVGISGDGLSITRLPFSRREAEAIIAAAPARDGMKALDFKASRETATSGELARYRIVHFATHGLLNSVHPELSGIILSLVDEQGRPVNGFLRLNEIYNLNLPAELVVLSACQTGLGKEIKGEGLVGLTRGFMYAGAARVVASLWKVDDAATAELMARFYKGVFKEKRRPAEALRVAQVEMWKQKRWQQPYYWAAFVLQGEWK